MKKYFFIILLGLIFTASCVFYVPYGEEAQPPEEEYYEEPSPGLDVSYFYDSLSPYGMWIYYPTYGYVWIPRDMPYAWRPYTHGHWVWTDYGWTWRSQIVWGWAPFHYGRWGWERDIGWFWVPGAVWGPGWVTWRSSNIYIGWAPLPPGVPFVAGVGIRRVTYPIPASHWVFVDGNSFLNPSLHLYVFPYERNITIVNYTVRQTNIYVRNNRVINEGIGIDRVRRITKRNISKYELKDTKKAELRRIEAGKLEVYRPKIKKNQVAKPKAVLRKQEAKERISKARITSVEGRDVHRREVNLLERSQQKEVKELERKLEERKKSVRAPAEIRRIEREHKEKLIKLKKSHEAEKVKIIKRHKEEEEKVKEKESEEKKEPEKKKKPEKKKVKKKVKK